MCHLLCPKRTRSIKSHTRNKRNKQDHRKTPPLPEQLRCKEGVLCNLPFVESESEEKEDPDDDRCNNAAVTPGKGYTSESNPHQRDGKTRAEEEDTDPIELEELLEFCVSLNAVAIGSDWLMGS